MLGVIFIIPLILPGLALAEETQKNTQNCTDPGVIEAGDTFFSCFNERVKGEVIQNTTCSLTETISNYTVKANATCYKDSFSMYTNASLFIGLTNFSLQKDSFKDFVKNNGTECIRAIKENFACVSKVVGIVDTGDKYETLWKKTNIFTLGSRACSYTIKVKECTLNAMRAEKEKCNHISTLLYVHSLFDVMIEQCHKNHKDLIKEEKRDEILPLDGANADFVKEAHTTQLLLGLLLTMAFLGILYVLYRDCRVKKSWKSINENFEMGRRRRSLVNNEMCHPGTAPPPASK